MKECMYCGNSVGHVGEGERVVPDAIGGSKSVALKSVCAKCNNGVLSDLDRELCSKSPLSLLAAKELGKPPEYLWDVEPTEGNLLLEARPSNEFRGVVLWPQIVFVSDRPRLYGDAEEIDTVGADRFRSVLVSNVLDAIAPTKPGKRGRRLRFECVGGIGPQYAYPPRIYARREVAQFDRKMHLTCRYARPADPRSFRRRVVRELLRCRAFRHSGEWSVQRGGHWPIVHTSCEQVKIVRALTKLALNLLSCVCEKTEVSLASFPDAIGLVRGYTKFPIPMLHHCGFAYAEDACTLECTPKAHSFRLLYDADVRLWNLYCAFFSGQMGAKVVLPGPNRENWLTCDISAPLRSDDWRVERSRIYRPTRMRVDWEDLQRTMVGISFINAKTNLRIEERRPVPGVDR
jgi:hypothetical protein